jgi:hypothetical protein
MILKRRDGSLEVTYKNTRFTIRQIGERVAEVCVAKEGPLPWRLRPVVEQVKRMVKKMMPPGPEVEVRGHWRLRRAARRVFEVRG